MKDRIDRYLAGELDEDALTPRERAQADALNGIIDETRAFLDAHPGKDLTASVMSSVAHVEPPAERPNLWKRLVDGFWSPREVSFTLRPAYGLLAVVLVAAVGALSPVRVGLAPAGAARPGEAVPDARFFLQFRLEAANASDVRLAGSFTDWQPEYRLHETAPGVWTITVPLSLGVHDYVFVVDGERWVSDPYAQHVDDGFGGTNSRIALLAPEPSQS